MQVKKVSQHVFNDHFGFSVVEILVVLGLLAVVATGITSFLTNGMKQQRGLQAKDQQRELTGEIRTLLLDANACAKTFLLKDPTSAGGTTVGAIKDAVGAAKFSVGNPDKTKLLMIDALTITDWTADADPTRGKADLTIRLSRIGDTGTARELKPDIISLKIKLSAGTIVECYPIGTKSDGLWQKSASDPNNIFYNVGNIGIGTINPTAQLAITKSGTPLTGAAMSTELTTNAGALGTVAGNELVLASIGFTSANQSAFGVRALRTADGSDWTTTAVGFGMDVDNSPRVNNAAIWFNGNGNMGIATAVPDSKLTIQGDGTAPYVISVGGSSNGRMKVRHIDGKGAGTNAVEDLYLQYDTGRSTYLNYNGGNVVANANSGSTGIGTTNPQAKLDVNGEAKIGNTGLPCNGATAGSMRYVGTMEYCNGTDWTAMGGGGSGQIIYVCPQYCIRWGPGPWLSTQSTCNNNYDSGVQTCTPIGRIGPL